MARDTQTSGVERRSGGNRQRRDPEVNGSKAAVRPEPRPHARGPSPEEIARRAYELYVARGSQPGNPDDDWLQAERELRLGRY